MFVNYFFHKNDVPLNSLMDGEWVHCGPKAVVSAYKYREKSNSLEWMYYLP